jgi:hypothetical protein
MGRSGLVTGRESDLVRANADPHKGCSEWSRRYPMQRTTGPFCCFPKGWLSRYCHGNRGKTLENHEQKVNSEEKLALVLHRKCLILLGKTSAPAKCYQATLRAVNRMVAEKHNLNMSPDCAITVTRNLFSLPKLTSFTIFLC